MNQEILTKFEDTKDFLERLNTAYVDGFIFESEETMVKWLGAMNELITDIHSIRQLVGMEYYNHKIQVEVVEELENGKVDTVLRIKELENELNK